MTLNEAMVHLKALRERHAELVQLRNENSAVRTRRFGVGGDKEVAVEPVYDVKALDKNVLRLGKEIRLLETAIKATNNVTPVAGYIPDDDVFTALDD